MYKDKDKQKETQRERQRRYRRDKEGVTEQGSTKGVTVLAYVPVSDQPTKVYPLSILIKDRLKSDQRFTRLMAQAGPGNIRVSKPDDDDYVPMCETTRRYINGRGAGR